MAYEPEPRKWEQKDWLYEQYWGKMREMHDIADEVGVSRSYIGQQLRKHGIPSRGRGYDPDGPNSPFTGFYNSNENAQWHGEQYQHFDPEYEVPGEPDWKRIAEQDPIVGDKATGQ